MARIAPLFFLPFALSLSKRSWRRRCSEEPFGQAQVEREAGEFLRNAAGAYSGNPVSQGDLQCLNLL